MEKFSFKQDRDLLIPNTKNMVFPKDENGREMSGDDFIRKMATIAKSWETKYQRPVPIPDTKFVAWLKQAKSMMDSGESYEDVLRRTVVFTHGTF